MTVKIVKLTVPNVQALTEMIEATKTTKVTLTKTTATFDVPNAVQALDIVTEFQREAVARFGATGHPNASLHAVRRKVEALAAEELNAAVARSEARAEADAATDPLVVLLTDEETVAEALGTTVENLDRDFPATPAPVTGLTVGATIRPKAWVTAHVEEPPSERHFRTRPGSHVAGRLLATSKCRRNRRR